MRNILENLVKGVYGAQGNGLNCVNHNMEKFIKTSLLKVKDGKNR